MKGILADNNIEGHLRVLASILESESWREIYEYFHISLLSYRDMGLAQDIADNQLWQFCQREELILLTANRNSSGPDSLEETLRTQNQEGCLPVLTIGNAQRVLDSKEYAERVVKSLCEYLIDIDNFRGTGRLYLP